MSVDLDTHVYVRDLEEHLRLILFAPGRAPDPRSFLGLLRAAADRAGDWTLHFSLDTNGVLQASATSPSGQRQPLTLEMPPARPESEVEPAPRPTAPETPAVPPETPGFIGGLKKLFGRR